MTCVWFCGASRSCRRGLWVSRDPRGERRGPCTSTMCGGPPSPPEWGASTSTLPSVPSPSLRVHSLDHHLIASARRGCLALVKQQDSLVVQMTHAQNEKLIPGCACALSVINHDLCVACATHRPFVMNDAVYLNRDNHLKNTDFTLKMFSISLCNMQLRTEMFAHTLQCWRPGHYGPAAPSQGRSSPCTRCQRGS